MKKLIKGLQIIMISVGIILIIVRFIIKYNYVGIFMSMINGTVLCLSIAIVIFTTIKKMERSFEEDKKRVNLIVKRNKSINNFTIISYSFLFILVLVIFTIQIVFCNSRVNDVITIITFIFALSNDVISDIMAALFYRYTKQI